MKPWPPIGVTTTRAGRPSIELGQARLADVARHDERPARSVELHDVHPDQRLRDTELLGDRAQRGPRAKHVPRSRDEACRHFRADRARGSRLARGARRLARLEPPARLRNCQLPEEPWRQLAATVRRLVEVQDFTVARVASPRWQREERGCEITGRRGARGKDRGLDLDPRRDPEDRDPLRAGDAADVVRGAVPAGKQEQIEPGREKFARETVGVGGRRGTLAEGSDDERLEAGAPRGIGAHLAGRGQQSRHRSGGAPSCAQRLERADGPVVRMGDRAPGQRLRDDLRAVASRQPDPAAEPRDRVDKEGGPRPRHPCVSAPAPRCLRR